MDQTDVQPNLQQTALAAKIQANRETKEFWTNVVVLAAKGFFSPALVWIGGTDKTLSFLPYNPKYWNQIPLMIGFKFGARIIAFLWLVCLIALIIANYYYYSSEKKKYGQLITFYAPIIFGVIWFVTAILFSLGGGLGA